ncbi:MAG: phosphoribosylformylglycinamidine cyclo-ligase [Candidatus Altiarchaeota archaeon]
MKEDDKKPDTYAKAGVDFRKEDRAIKSISRWVCKTFKFREGKIGCVMEDLGLFANLIDMGEFALAVCTDGVGSKVLVAQEMEKYDTVGIDLVAMNVNDLICIGAEPVCMVDYLAMQNTNEEMAKEISIGIYEGSKQAEICIIGGETASLPEIITGVKNRGFDLAGTAIGVVKKEAVITGKKIRPGDAVLGFASSGIHSNGLTLARKLLPRNMWMNLLVPTKIYVKEVKTLLSEFKILGLANITGGGMLNLTRITKHGFLLDNMPEPQMVFKKMQELGNISDEEMYKTFNMGVGLCAVAREEEADRIIGKYGREMRITRIGTVVPDAGVKLVLDGREVVLERSMY